MNFGELYIFLCQQLESEKRLRLQLFDTFLTKKLIWHKDLSETFQMC